MPPLLSKESEFDPRRLSIEEALLAEEETRLLRRREQLARRTSATAGIARGLGLSGTVIGSEGLPALPSAEPILTAMRLREAVLRSRMATVGNLSRELALYESALDGVRSSLAMAGRRFQTAESSANASSSSDDAAAGGVQ